MDDSIADHRHLLSELGDVWSGDGDFSKLDVIAESFELHDPSAPDNGIHGRDELKAFIREFRTSFPDLEVTSTETLIGEDVVMAEWTETGTYNGEFKGIAPTGREIEDSGMSLFVMADGKIQEERLYYDLHDLYEQLRQTNEGDLVRDTPLYATQFF